MKKIIYTAIIGLGMLVMSGCEANGHYALSSGTTGTFANIKASTVEKGGRYEIRIDATTSGIYNFLKGKRTEKYRSKGHIKKGIYYSDIFTMERWKGRSGFHDLKQYRFDHKRHRVLIHYQRWEGSKKIEDTTKKLSFYTHDDYFTVIHNAIKYGKSKYYRIAGSEETNGKVPVYISKDTKLIRKWGGPSKGGMIVQIGIFKGIFVNKKGSMTIVLDGKQRPVKFVLSNLKTIKTAVGRPSR